MEHTKEIQEGFNDVKWITFRCSFNPPELAAILLTFNEGAQSIFSQFIKVYSEHELTAEIDAANKLITIKTKNVEDSILIPFENKYTPFEFESFYYEISRPNQSFNMLCGNLFSSGGCLITHVRIINLD